MAPPRDHRTEHIARRVLTQSPQHDEVFWTRVRELFHAASEIPPDQRETFLRAEGADSRQRAEVLSLLSSADSAEGFLEPPRRHRRSFETGELIAGRYVIGTLLGIGGMGEVYEAEDRELQEHVALKIIRPEIAANPRIVERFRREIQLARRVTHPNVCRIYDVSHHLSRSEAGEPERRITFVSMELLHGRTLASQLREHGRMTTLEARPIVAQMTAGLDAAHAAGVVHRDFKTSNVLLVSQSGGSRAVITDFGLAHEAEGKGDRLTDSGMVIGTPDYMAPEQLENGPITPATDVYALGVVLFEMVTGQLPFHGSTPLTTAVQRLKDPAPSPRQFVPELDPRWDAVILRCLERDAALRFPRAGAVLEALESTATITTRSPRRVAAAGTVIVLAAALTAVSLPFLLGDRNPAPDPQPVARPASTVATPALRRAVAVAGFRSLSASPEDAWLADAVPELLKAELGAAESLRLIAGEDVQSMQQDLALRAGEPLARPLLEQVRDRVGADVVITGSCITAGSGPSRSVRVDLRLQDTQTGATLATLNDSAPEAQLFALISRVGAAARSRLGSVSLSAGEIAGLRATLPRNPEAARAYVEGLTRLRRFDALGARASFERAIAIESSYALAHAALAESLWTLGFEEPARQSANRAMERATGLPREDRLSIEARAAIFHHQFEKAIEIYRSLLTFYPDDLSYGLRLATTQIAAGRAKDALVTVDQLRKLPPPLNTDPAIDLAAAEAFHITHENEKELEVARRAEIVGAASKMRGIVARAKANQSFAHRELGHPDQAIALLRESAAISEELGDRAAASRSYSNLGLALWNSGNVAEAEPLLERALVMQRQVGARSSEARTLNTLGIIRFVRGNIDGAEKAWRESLVVQRESNFHTLAGTTLANLGGARQMRGDFVEAESLYRQAIEAATKTDDKIGEVMGSVNLAELLRLRGSLDASRPLYEQGLRRSRELTLRPSEGYVLAAMGELALMQGDLARAKTLHQQGLAVRRALKDGLSVAQSQTMLANLAIEEGRAAEALPLLDAAIAVFAGQGATDEEALAQETRVRALLASKRLDEARTAMARAKALAAKSHALSVMAAVRTAEARVLYASNATSAASMRSAAIALAKKSSVLGLELEARLIGADDAERAHVAATAREHGMLLIARKAR